MSPLRTRRGQSPAPPGQVITSHAGSVPRGRRHLVLPCPSAGTSGRRRAAPCGHSRPRSTHRGAPRLPAGRGGCLPGSQRGTDARGNEADLAGPRRLRGGEAAGARGGRSSCGGSRLRSARAGKRSAPARARRNTLTGGKVCSPELRRSRLQSISHSLRSWGCGKDQRRGLRLKEPERW